MTNEVREYLNSQESEIKAQYEVLEGKGYISLIKNKISLEDRYEDINNAVRLGYSMLDTEKEVSLGL